MNICPNCCSAELENNTCPKCGYILGTEEPPVHTLPYGTVLQSRYMIGKVLGEGGFGITYLGYDNRLNTKIAVKEYYPAGFVSRQNTDYTHTVHTFTGDKETFFIKGLDRFMKEAQRLSKFTNAPGVVNVRDVFSENNTAYIVMEFIEGTSLSNILKNVGKVSEKSTLEMFEPIIKTLVQMHAEGIIHRDIAPDNIMVQPDGAAKLIDFGAAIEKAEEIDGKSTVALVKHGYAAEEHYDNNHSRQGTWTDVYSLCATMYRTLTGNVPPDALDRMRGTELPEITGGITEKVKNAIYHGMAVNIKDRTQTMGALLSELEGSPAPAQTATHSDMQSAAVQSAAVQPAAQPVKQNFFCGFCGAKLSADAKFCPTCGETVQTDNNGNAANTSGTALEARPALSLQNVKVPEKLTDGIANIKNNANSKRYIMFGIAAVMLVVVIIVLVRIIQVAGAEDKINDFILDGDYQSAYDLPGKLKLKNADELRQSILLENIAAFGLLEYINETEFDYTDTFVLEDVYFARRGNAKDITDYHSYYTLVLYGPKKVNATETMDTYVVTYSDDGDNLPRWALYVTDRYNDNPDYKQNISNLNDTINYHNYENDMVNTDRLNELRDNGKLDDIEKIDLE